MILKRKKGKTHPPQTTPPEGKKKIPIAKTELRNGELKGKKGESGKKEEEKKVPYSDQDWSFKPRSEPVKKRIERSVKKTEREPGKKPGKEPGKESSKEFKKSDKPLKERFEERVEKPESDNN